MLPRASQTTLVGKPPPQTLWPAARRIFEDVVRVLAYCHSRGVSHRDVRTVNIVVDPASAYRAYLIDFGRATRDAADQVWDARSLADLLFDLMFLAPPERKDDPSRYSGEVPWEKL